MAATTLLAEAIVFCSLFAFSYNSRNANLPLLLFWTNSSNLVLSDLAFGGSGFVTIFINSLILTCRYLFINAHYLTFQHKFGDRRKITIGWKKITIYCGKHPFRSFLCTIRIQCILRNLFLAVQILFVLLPVVGI